MTDDRDTPKSAEAFDDALGELIRTAFENGIRVEGGWDVQNGVDGRSWTVEITRVEAED